MRPPPSATTHIDGRTKFLGPLLAANVSAYRGDTILFASPDAPDIEPDRVYRVLRAPSKLKKATGTFSGVPLVSRHIDLNEEITPGLVWGAIGTDAMLDDLLSATVTLWSLDAINAIGRGEKRALSAAYAFEADKTPGEYRGVAYDGILRNIHAHHCALFPFSRSGVVLDGSFQSPRSTAA